MATETLKLVLTADDEASKELASVSSELDALTEAPAEIMLNVVPPEGDIATGGGGNGVAGADEDGVDGILPVGLPGTGLLSKLATPQVAAFALVTAAVAGLTVGVTQLVGLFNELDDITNSLSLRFYALSGDLAQSRRQAQQFVAALHTSSLRALGELPIGLQLAFQELHPDVAKAAADLAKDIEQATANTLTPISEAEALEFTSTLVLGDVDEGEFQTFGQKLGFASADAFRDRLADFDEDPFQALNQYVTDATNNLSDHRQAVIDLEDTWRDFTKNLREETLSPVGDFIIGFWTRFLKGLMVYVNIFEFFRNFFTNTLPEELGKLWGEAATFFSGPFLDIVNGLWDSVETFFTETLPDAIDDLWDGVVQFFTVDLPEKISGIPDIIGDIFGNPLELGREYASEFIDGITSFFTDTLPGTLGGLGSWFADQLGFGNDDDADVPDIAEGRQANDPDRMVTVVFEVGGREFSKAVINAVDGETNIARPGLYGAI